MVGKVYKKLSGLSMKSIFEFKNIYIHKGFVDFRNSINGLSVIVSHEMRLDIKSPSLFVFTNRRRSHLKILYFDRSGFALWLKRLEGAKFPWPKELDKEVIEITVRDMELLLDGVNVWTRFKKVNFEYLV